MKNKIAVAVGLVTPPAAFAWHLGEKVHTFKFFLEAPHDPAVRFALGAASSGTVTTLIAFIALFVGVAAFRTRKAARNAESKVASKRSRSVRVVEEREEIHKTRIVKTISDGDD